MRQFLVVIASLVIISASPAAAQYNPECGLEGWLGFLAPGPQTHKAAEDLSVSDGRDITIVKFGKLAGNYAKVYLFAEWDGDCLLRVVSVGSYATTNAGESKRIYHTDLYTHSAHYTLGIGDRKPSFKNSKDLALKALLPRQSGSPSVPYVSKTEMR